jgi:hypothetical protein
MKIDTHLARDPVLDQADNDFENAYRRKLMLGMISAGWTRSAIASRSIVSSRTDRRPHSIRLTWVRCKRAASAKAS